MIAVATGRGRAAAPAGAGRVLGCEAVVDAHDREATGVDDDLVELIHHLGATGRPDRPVPSVPIRK